MAGLTAQGFEKKSLSEIKTEVENRFRTIFGNFINLLPASVFTTVIGIFAERLSEVWDVAEEIYNSRSPSKAAGASLDDVGDINGIERLEATESFVNDGKQLLFGDSGTIIPAGTQFSVEGNPSAVFETDTQVELVAGTDCVQTLEFGNTPNAGSFKLKYRDEETDAILHSDNAATVQTRLRALTGLSEVTVTGTFADDFVVTFAGADGKQEQPALEAVDNTLNNTGAATSFTATMTTPGVNQGAVGMTATATGPKAAPIYTLTVIDTPVSGLTATRNIEDADVGRNEETDAEYRLRRKNSLSIGGNASLEAIRAKLLNVADVVAVAMFENISSIVADGRPPKSFEAVIDGGDNAEIATTIWLAKPAGIETYGNETEQIVDSQGVTRDIKFSRATQIPIYCSFDLTVDDALFPDDGADLVEEAILEWAATLAIGSDVIVYPQLITQFNGIPGILNIRTRIGTSPVSVTPGDPAADANIVLSIFQKAQFTAGNINVNVLP